MIEGPNGCTCGYNGDCNCPFVDGPLTPAEIRALDTCEHGVLHTEHCDPCDGFDEYNDQDEDAEDLYGPGGEG